MTIVPNKPEVKFIPETPGRAVVLKKRLEYLARWMPSYLWQAATRRSPNGPVHLIIALADHFEPAIVPEDGQARVPYGEQERRLERWCKLYPEAAERWRDHEGHPFVHTYFYPIEQYDKQLVARLADFCRQGWGEVEIHLHHGVGKADTAEHTRQLLTEVRDALAHEHGCLARTEESESPRYVFIHGNYALANSAGGRACGVDSEMQILSETGCYADMTLPASVFHWAQTAKINSLYECALPLDRRAPHRRGNDLRVGKTPRIFPLMVQGPLLPDFTRSERRRIGLETAALTKSKLPDIRRVPLWKRAAVSVQGRPDWVFIKLHCHGMDPTQEPAMLGAPMRKFLADLIDHSAHTGDVLHFVTAREMVNMILAACDGRNGNPGAYRDYRFKRFATMPVQRSNELTAQSSSRG